MAVHYLKIRRVFFNKIVDGSKRFEIRKDDRGFKEGDCLILQEVREGSYTGNQICVFVSYILYDAPFYGLKEGYCIMSISVQNVIIS